MIITSDTTFFDNLRGNSTNFDKIRAFFQDAYDFVKNYKNLGEENIISAVVHMDEKTPHVHLVFIPVVDSVNKEGEKIRKIGGYEFWKEKNSYNILQDKFYKYITEKGYDLERGRASENNPHRTMKELKQLTNFYETKKIQQDLEQEDDSFVSRDIYKDFLMDEDFTVKNVENKLIQPMLKHIQDLRKENKDLLVELVRAKNARKYYEELQIDNEKKEKIIAKLKEESAKNQIERNACYDIIKELSMENEKIKRVLREKYGVDIDFDDKPKEHL